MQVNKRLDYRINTEGCVGSKRIHDSAGCNRSEHLGQDVEDTSENADLAADQQAQCHGGVQVCPTDVTEGLSQRGDRQRKGQGHLDLLGYARTPVFPDDRAQSEEYEEQHAEKLCQHGSPKRPALYLCHCCARCVRCFRNRGVSDSLYIVVARAKRGEERVKEESKRCTYCLCEGEPQ